VPPGAEVEAENNKYVEQDRVQLGVEKTAVTPDGSEEAENVTGTAFPETKVAVISTVDPCQPLPIQMIGVETDSDMTVEVCIGATMVRVIVVEAEVPEPVAVTGML